VNGRTTAAEVSPHEEATLPVHRFESFGQHSAVHGITTRTDALPLHGNMSFMVGDAPELVLENRRAWSTAIGFNPERLTFGRQVHETTVVAVEESHAGSGADSVETSIRRVDGLVTNRPGLPLGVMAADCVPLLLHDPVRGVVGAIHAGWRGTVDGIAVQALEAVARKYGSPAEDVIIGIGPSICHDCYQVGDEVVERWVSSPYAAGTNALSIEDSGFYFNLREANRQQLINAGVPESSIEVSPVCTRCANGKMFSRRGLGPRTGLFSAIIMLPELPIEHERK
jgi:polyphenol oxidase